MTDLPQFSPDAWPAVELASTLRILIRDFLQESPHPLLKGRDSWPNQQPELYPGESAVAERLGVRALGLKDADFPGVISGGKRFNWAIGLDGSLKVSPAMVMSSDGPRRISHAILSAGGGDVLAAGEGRYPDFLSNTTGHYKNEDFVLVPVKRAFELIGIVFQR